MKKDLKQLIKDFPHLEEATQAVLDRLKESRKTCIIMPTGTGKTIISSQMVKNLGLKSMYLCPSEYILGQTKEKFSLSGVSSEFMTYPKMMSLMKRNDFSRFKDIDLFILDEFHRLGAAVWGKSWKKIEDAFPDSKVLGLTATEIRYLDGGRDMARELFERNVAYEITKSECFERGILRSPKYVIGCDLTTGFSELEDKIKTIKSPEHKKKVSKMIEKLRGNWENTKGTSGIYKEYILDNLDVSLHKILVFHERINEVEDIKKIVLNSLRGAGYTGPIKFYVANSEKGGLYSQREVKLFNQKNSGYGINILLAVNMLNEGLHVKGCEIAIMYRKTMSKNIYFQQIGRVLSIGIENNPVILDLVQNVSLSDGIVIRKNNKSSSSKARTRKAKFNLPDDYEITQTLLDYQKICESFDEDKQIFLTKLDEWYNLALTGNLNAFKI